MPYRGNPCTVRFCEAPPESTQIRLLIIESRVAYNRHSTKVTHLKDTDLQMPIKLTTEILTAALAGYEEQKKRLDAQIAGLRQMLDGGSTDGSAPETAQPRRKMSAAARKRIAAAQRRRWVEARNQSGDASKIGPAPARKKRRLSAAGRKAIIAATKRRWAAVRKTQAK
jgi:hypothetical protein